MYSHTPSGYLCPMCNRLSGYEDEYAAKEDIVLQTDLVTAFISPKWWINNPGHVIIIPNKHFENIYNLPQEYGHAVFDTAQKIAVAFKEAYRSDGTSLRQHNEPAGNQDIWHFHLHVFPRYNNDNLYLNHDKSSYTSKEERLPYANKLRNYFSTNNE